MIKNICFVHTCNTLTSQDLTTSGRFESSNLT
ncbi:hypothetical protein RB653_002073 [Dictyostelium firmibasis]|uniref:Uncharacterized protein n=1 Tax=Dictyostelium firmibasis TaxID=79012 RepID=A0AAN7TXW7_9MYCE